MIRRMLALSVCLLCVLITASASADQALIKKLVIEDCKAAIANVGALPQDGQLAMLPYLGLVLKLQTHDPLLGVVDTSAFTKRSGFSAPYGDFQELEAWKSLNSSREISARRCAAEILRNLAPASFALVPDIVEVSQQRALPEDLREQLAEVALEITTKAARTEQFVFDPVVMKRIASLTDTEEPVSVHNVVLELGDLIVPFLFEEVRKPEPAHRDRVVRAILFADRKSPAIASGLIGLLDSGDDALRRQGLDLLGGFPEAAEQSLPRIITHLSDLSRQVEDAAISALEKLSAVKRSAPLEREPAQRLYDAFTGGDALRRERLLPTLVALSTHLPDFQAKLTHIIEGGDSDLRRRGLEIAGRVGEDALYGLVEKYALQQLDPSAQDQAIATLGKFKSKRTQVIEVLSRVLRAARGSKDTVRRSAIEASVVSSLMSIGAGKDAVRVAPLLIEALPSLPKAKDLLISIGREIEPRIVPILKHPTPTVRIAAADILGSFGALASSSTQGLVALLRDPSVTVRQAAERALVKGGASAKQLLVRTLGQKGTPSEQATAIARILATIDPKDQKPLPILIEALKGAPCEQKAPYASLVVGIQGGTSPQLAGIMLDCLSSAASPSAQSELLDELARIGPLNAAERERLLEILRRGTLARPALSRALEQWKQLGIPIDELLALTRPILKESDNSLKLFAITLVRALGEDGRPLIPDLLSLREDSSAEAVIRHEAAISVVGIDSGAFNYEEFFLSELRGEHKEWAERSLKRLGPSRALPIFQKALEGASGDLLVNVIRSIGEFGEEAAPLSATLSTLLRSPVPAARFAALVALLKVNPDIPDVVPELRRALISIRRQQLLDEAWGDRARRAFRAVADSPSNRTEAVLSSRVLRDGEGD